MFQLQPGIMAVEPLPQALPQRLHGQARGYGHGAPRAAPEIGMDLPETQTLIQCPGRDVIPVHLQRQPPCPPLASHRFQVGQQCPRHPPPPVSAVHIHVKHHRAVGEKMHKGTAHNLPIGQRLIAPAGGPEVKRQRHIAGQSPDRVLGHPRELLVHAGHVGEGHAGQGPHVFQLDAAHGKPLTVHRLHCTTRPGK